MSSTFKPYIGRFIEPIARAASRIGITPNAVTLVGTIGSAAAAMYFYPHGELFVGTSLSVSSHSAIYLTEPSLAFQIKAQARGVGF